VRLFVVKQNRRNATLQLLKRAVDKKRFGRIYMVNLNVFWTRPPEYYHSAKWRGTWEFDGGAFMNQASHYVDLIDWIVGPVEACRPTPPPWRATSRSRIPACSACAGAMARWAR
jgi:UDP-N-acetyl-2-amino-2-deoxyglucuronate dehydrogenase